MYQTSFPLTLPSCRNNYFLLFAKIFHIWVIRVLRNWNVFLILILTAFHLVVHVRIFVYLPKTEMNNFEALTVTIKIDKFNFLFNEVFSQKPNSSFSSNYCFVVRNLFNSRTTVLLLPAFFMSYMIGSIDNSLLSVKLNVNFIFLLTFSIVPELWSTRIFVFPPLILFSFVTRVFQVEHASLRIVDSSLAYERVRKVAYVLSEGETCFLFFMSPGFKLFWNWYDYSDGNFKDTFYSSWLLCKL